MGNKEFFDINKLPKAEGVLLFGISMNQIDNIQSSKKCFEYMNIFIPKVSIPFVGLNIVYADSLYLYSDKKACELKNKYHALAHGHKFGFIKLLKQNPQYTPTAFSFTTWNQMILNSKIFLTYFGELQAIYRGDEDFQYFLLKDINSTKDEVTQNQINFILEEILMFYLASKGKIRLQNDYIQDKQKWILWCYPGKPLLSEIYLYQKNFFNLKNPENIYENSFYDLDKQILYDFLKIDLRTF
jgi:hypothetical protein